MVSAYFTSGQKLVVPNLVKCDFVIDLIKHVATEQCNENVWCVMTPDGDEVAV